MKPESAGSSVDGNFAVNVHHDPMASLADGVHASDEQVTCNSLNDVLDKLSAVSF